MFTFVGTLPVNRLHAMSAFRQNRITATLKIHKREPFVPLSPFPLCTSLINYSKNRGKNKHFTGEKSKQNGRLSQASGESLNAPRVEDSIAGGDKSASQTIVAQMENKGQKVCS